MCNQKLTIMQHWVHKTQDEDKQNKDINRNTTEKTKKMSNTNPSTTLGEPRRSLPDIM